LNEKQFIYLLLLTLVFVFLYTNRADEQERKKSAALCLSWNIFLTAGGGGSALSVYGKFVLVVFVVFVFVIFDRVTRTGTSTGKTHGRNGRWFCFSGWSRKGGELAHRAFCF
jgi:uncharacterized membrane protein